MVQGRRNKTERAPAIRNLKHNSKLVAGENGIPRFRTSIGCSGRSTMSISTWQSVPLYPFTSHVVTYLLVLLSKGVEVEVECSKSLAEMVITTAKSDRANGTQDIFSPLRRTKNE